MNFIIIVILAIALIGTFSYALASNVTFTIPNLEQCQDGYYVKGFNLDGSIICNPLPTGQTIITNGTGGDFTDTEVSNLKTLSGKLSNYDDSTHTYLNSRFNGVGENLVPSGSQFQIYCDGVENQDCYLFMTSADNKEAGLILSKNINGAWSKIGAFVESTDHSNFQILGYNSTGAGIPMFKFYDDRIEMQNKLRIMSKNTVTGATSELFRTYDDNKISLYSGTARCYITVVSGYVKCN